MVPSFLSGIVTLQKRRGSGHEIWGVHFVVKWIHRPSVLFGQLVDGLLNRQGLRIAVVYVVIETSVPRNRFGTDQLLGQASFKLRSLGIRGVVLTNREGDTGQVL